MACAWNCCVPGIPPSTNRKKKRNKMTVHTADQRYETKNKSTTGQRRRLFKLHSWVGFHLALLMVVVLFTGTIATVSNEIDWLLNKEMRVKPDGDRVSWQQMTDAIKVYAPNSDILSLKAPDGDYLAYRAIVKSRNSMSRYVYVNQWTGEVTGSTGLLTVQRFFRDLHRYLFMPNVLGLPIVSSMAFILAIALYTGLKTSRNWATLMTRIRVKKGLRIFVGDAHKAVGLWGIWFVILMSVTGVWYLAEFGSAVAGVRFEPERPRLEKQQLERLGNVIKSPQTSDIVFAAQKSFPNLEITSIRFPTRANQGITVLGTTGNPLLRSRANRVFLNPETLEPIKVQRSQDIGWIAWINEIVDPLHFGFFAGLTSKLIWFVFGLGMTGMSISGVWLTWKRTKTRAVTKAQYATMPVLLVALLSGYFWWYQRYVPDPIAFSEQNLTGIQQGEITVSTAIDLNRDALATGRIRFMVSGDGGRPNIRRATLKLLDREGNTDFENYQVKLEHLAELSLLTSQTKSEALFTHDTLKLDLEMHSGETLSFSWPANTPVQETVSQGIVPTDDRNQDYLSSKMN